MMAIFIIPVVFLLLLALGFVMVIRFIRKMQATNKETSDATENPHGTKPDK